MGPRYKIGKLHITHTKKTWLVVRMQSKYEIARSNIGKSVILTLHLRTIFFCETQDS